MLVEIQLRKLFDITVFSQKETHTNTTIFTSHVNMSDKFVSFLQTRTIEDVAALCGDE